MTEKNNSVPEAPAPNPGPPKTRGLSKGFWIGMLVLAAFLAFGLSSFRKSLTPYVSFGDARKSQTVVQVVGAPVKGSDKYDDTLQELHFDILDDKKDLISIVYGGVKPANFNDAVSVVAIGKYDRGAIHAEKLLVKCPSKYQGQEVEKEYPARVPKAG